MRKRPNVAKLVNTDFIIPDILLKNKIESCDYLNLNYSY